MNKKNNKAFLLAESLIVTTFVLTVLIYLYAQFKNLMTEYKNSYRYNNVQDIYNLGAVGKFITKNNINISGNGIIYEKNESPLPDEDESLFKDMLNDMNIEYIIYEDSNIDKVKERMSNYNPVMQDFIKKINTKKIDGKGRLIAKFKNNNFATIIIEKNNSGQP